MNVQGDEARDERDHLLLCQASGDLIRTRIGYCDGKLIRWDNICATFCIDIEEPSAETCYLAFDLFNQRIA